MNTQELLECVQENAQKATESLLPFKSKQKYEKEYETFRIWQPKNGIAAVNETVLLAYFQELSENYTPTSLWTKYSLLKLTLIVNVKIDISNYNQLISFKSKGYKPKKSQVLTGEQVMSFIKDAPDHVYLLHKVVLVMGVFGGLRRDEMVKMCINDKSDKGSVLIVKVPETKTDDAAHTGIAMGTPGDKAKIGKVVQGSQLDPDQESVPQTTTTTPAPTPSASTSTATSSEIPPIPQPSTSGAEMGMISRLPQFETFAAINIHPSLSQTAAVKPETFQSNIGTLEQAHIEDYFTQSKYYPSVSENLQTLYHPVMPPKPKTFLSLGEPGPSGLQTQRSKQKISVKRTKKSSQIQKKGHPCPVCQKTFATVDKLSKHQQIHSGTSPFKCEHCKKSFSSKFKLVRHVLIHSDRKPFSCTVCERTFHRKDHLKNHIKVHSPSKKVYVCEKPDCKKEYTSLMSYRKHQALHAAEEGSLQCQICSSVFPTKEEILYHLKIHAGSRTVKNPNEKKFTCEHCERKFFTKKDVRRHLVVHTGMRDFLCQFCPQRFGRKDHLVRHIKKSHSKNVPPEDIETAIKSEIPETIVKPELIIKPDPEIKTEFSESSLSNPEQFDLSFEEVSSILQQETFDPLTPFLEPDPEGNLTFLPSTSSQEELKDLGSTILEEIGEPSIIEESLTDPDEVILSQSVLSNPELQRLLEPSEDKNLPLPGFSQTFQPQPPPPPPPQ